MLSLLTSHCRKEILPDLVVQQPVQESIPPNQDQGSYIPVFTDLLEPQEEQHQSQQQPQQQPQPQQRQTDSSVLVDEVLDLLLRQGGS